MRGQMGIKNYYNLFALEKIRDDLKKWIRKDREFLDEYKHFYYRDGELYFHLRHPGIHLNGSPTKLEDLPLTSKQKQNIEAVCHKIRNQEADLRYKEREIKELHKRDNSTEQNTKYDYLETVEEDNPKIKPIVQEMLDKWYETEIIDSYTPIKELVKRVKPALIKKCGTLPVKTDTINSYVKYWRRIEGFTKTKRGKK